MDTLNTISAPHQLVLFRGEANAKQLPTESKDLPVPLEMFSLFEAISGWVVEFQKTSASGRRSAMGQSGGSSLQGNFTIVDMSAEWPANRPTASRIKCDQFLKLLSDLVLRSQLLADELQRSKRFSADETNSDSAISEIHDEEVRDHFEPRHRYLTQFELDSDFVISAERDSEGPGLARRIDREKNTESKFSTGTVEALMPVPKWQIGGRRGIQENRYIDWAIRNDHRIELIVGQIEFPETSDCQLNQEWETKLTISPETSRFWFSVEPRGCYWLFDQATCRLNRISEFSKVSQLDPHQALVVTTVDLNANDAKDIVELGLEDQANLFQNADDLASAIQNYLQTDEPLLVLLRQ